MIGKGRGNLLPFLLGEALLAASNNAWGYSLRSWRIGQAVALAVLVAYTAITFGASFEVVLSERQLASAETKYGIHARKRLSTWLDLMASNKQKSEQEKLELVNNFFNQILFVSDLDHWGVVDYWATPLELLGTGGGDCEDYSISKYFTLLALGVPIDKLKITYVKASGYGLQNAAHMVLTYYASPGAMPLVLDNLNPEIKPADKRLDLTPVYSFNGDGLWLAKERGTGKSVAGGNKISLWRDMMARMGKEF
jgi:predicted transglutaminase-like cysteine proteinase